MTADATQKPWLAVDADKRSQRSIKIVSDTIAALETQGTAISIASIIRMSVDVDPEKRGVSKNAILFNPECRALYQQHRTWTPRRPSRRLAVPKQFAKLTKAEMYARMCEAEERAEKFERANEELTTENLKLQRAARRQGS